MILAVSACDARTSVLTADHRAAMADSVRAFVEGIPHGLAADGPPAWLRYFEDAAAFFMASDGRVAFPGPDSARAFVESLAVRVTGMSLVWEDLRIEPLAPGLATVAAAYRESIAFTNGSSVAFGGYMTGLARNHGGAWRLQHLHWSSPVTPGN